MQNSWQTMKKVDGGGIRWEDMEIPHPAHQIDEDSS